MLCNTVGYIESRVAVDIRWCVMQWGCE